MDIIPTQDGNEAIDSAKECLPGESLLELVCAQSEA